MAQPKKELFPKWRDWTEKNRNWILYGAVLLTLFGLLAGWNLLPDQVVIQAAAEGQAAVPLDKPLALGATAALTAFFAVLFAVRPRELVYFVALCLGVFLVYSLLIVNLAV